MTDTVVEVGHDVLMDAQYRWQRHVYDFSRKYYLLGRDGLIRGLAVPPGGSVLEIGCGTGRNLALVGQRYPGVRLFGIDISTEMLKSARRRVPSAHFVAADATNFDAKGVSLDGRFDRMFMSYTLSMIPDWQGAVDQAARLIGPGEELHIVDFGSQDRLPGWFRRMLRAWLTKFHVTPRADLFAASKAVAARYDLICECRSLFRGYAWQVLLKRAA